MFWQLQQTWEASTLQQRPQMQPEQNERVERVLQASHKAHQSATKQMGHWKSVIPPGIWTPHRLWGPAGPTVTRAKMHRKCRDMQRLSDLYQEQCRDYQRFRRNVKKIVKIWKKKTENPENPENLNKSDEDSKVVALRSWSPKRLPFPAALTWTTWPRRCG